MTTPAPVLNKIAISPPVPSLAQPTEAGRERVVAAVEFGAVLEELVARARLRPDGTDALQTQGPRFPPDLVHRRSPEALLRGALKKLLKLELTLLGLGQSYDGSPPPALPSRDLGIQQRIDALLQVHAQGDGGSQALESYLSGPEGLDDMIVEWDTRVVDLVLDSPVVLNAYKVGKALSMTRWRIWAAEHRDSVGGNPPLNSWDEAFGKQRISEIQRSVNALSTVLDPKAATVVSTSLGYWRNALLSLSGGPSNVRPVQPTASGEQPIEIASEYGEKLLKALEEQLVNWFDLLTGRRPPGSFPVAGIITALTKSLTANLGARVFRFLVPIVAGVAILVVLAALLMAVVLVFSNTATDVGIPVEGASSATDRDLAGGLLGSVGTALGGVFTFLIVQGRSLLNRGTGTVDQVRERVDDLQERLEDRFDRAVPDGAMAALGLPQVSLQGLKRDVLSSVIEQIRLEELNLAVSEPLVRCVLILNDRESGKGDPMEDAERFLRLVYGERSNLDRLRPVFEDLYKHYRATPSG